MLSRKSNRALFQIFRYYLDRLNLHVFAKQDRELITEQLDPGVTVIPIQPFYCENNILKILSETEDPNRSRESVLARLQSKSIDLHPYVVYHLFDAVVFSDHVFCAKFHHTTAVSPTLDAARLLDIGSISEAALADTHFASIYWGHWLSFELPTQMILNERAPLISSRENSKYRDEDQWRNLLLASPITRGKAFMVDRLMIAAGTSESITCIKYHAAIRETFGLNRSHTRRRIFLLRSPEGSARTVSNQEELMSALQLEGYEIVDPGKLKFETFLMMCKEAEEIVSIEGSHLISTMYLVRRDGLVVVLQPPGRVGLNHNDACHFLGIATAIFVGSPSGSDRTCFSVDVGALIRFLEQARKWAAESQQKLADFSGVICGA